ncbi:immunoglobulin domain-containing protein [Chitinimonas sp. BJB300]|uniref:immunoglobulin domain-containing protein n=1 Tax=Chitinimonas sp. BJB300 TaxID=1559339 RepID=UPI000C0D8B36|nr:immunoglobulin domain-containing protein [Chitinimonas sp. BJB300]PHV10026.1 hypothetical protein CSQ89_18415 [Chitinimonas sp. BJB300]TSJ90136.1 DUF3500 domain-containing protein [Chitinimonas sp. BJB300]
MTSLFIRCATVFCLLTCLVACEEAPLNTTTTTTTPANAPTLTSQPASITASLGTAVSLTVAATGTNLTYQWFKDNVAISGATSATYTIASAAATDSGSYTVQVSNSSGSVTSAPAVVTITSTSMIQITTQPVATSTTVGGSASFTVVATGSNLIYQWYFEGAPISRANSATYTINSAKASDEGIYYVSITAATGPGGADSDKVKLTVSTVSPVQAAPMAVGGYPLNQVISSAALDNNSQLALLESQRAAVHRLATAIQANSTTAAIAKLSGSFTDITMGISSNDKRPTYPTADRGIQYTALSANQQAYVKAAIEAWVNTLPKDQANYLLADYESDSALASTYVAYAPGLDGTADFSTPVNSFTSTLNGQRSYIRIDGPRVWIEFIVPQGDATNSSMGYRSIWRDKMAANDGTKQFD